MRGRVSFFVSICVASWSRVLTVPAARYEASQIGSKINETQKEIGKLKKVCAYRARFGYIMTDHAMLMQAKEDATALLERKAALEKEKKETEDLALLKENKRDIKTKSVGNYVHDSVPVSDNEVGSILREGQALVLIFCSGQQRRDQDLGPRGR